MKNILVEEIIKSLTENYYDWEFNRFTANNKKIGISIWIYDTKFSNLTIYEPVELDLSFFDKIKIYIALNKCKANILLSLINNKTK